MHINLRSVGNIGTSFRYLDFTSVFTLPLNTSTLLRFGKKNIVLFTPLHVFDNFSY